MPRYRSAKQKLLLLLLGRKHCTNMKFKSNFLLLFFFFFFFFTLTINTYDAFERAQHEKEDDDEEEN
jgi:hypothetical protein